MFSVVENYNDVEEDFSSLKLSSLAQFVLEHECKYENAYASINFINISEIHKLNKLYRGIDKPTDVLSFECDGVSDDFVSNGDFELGDIFICYEVASQNAKKFNSSIDSEIKLLVVHGMLHLCGYDHINEDEAKVMEAKEDKILDAWDKQ